MGKLAQLANPAVSIPKETTPAPSEPAISNPTRPAGRVNPASPASLDPRPDLAEDHRDWLAVLVMCRHDKQLFGLLHGLRCGGARLEVREGKRGPHYRLDYEPLLDTWDKDALLREWLEPNRGRIKAALERGLQAKKAVELQMEQETERARRLAEREPEQVGLRF